MKRSLPVLFVLFSAVLCAQSGEVWIDAGASALANPGLGTGSPTGDTGNIYLSHAGFRIGLRFDYNSAGQLGQEVQYAYNHTGLNDPSGLILQKPGSDGMGINQFGYNLLYHLNSTSREAKVRPFLTVGVHLNDFVMPYAVNNRDNADSWRPGFNYGGGMKFRLSQMFAWRFDIRGYDSGKPNWSSLLFRQSGLLQQFEATAGLGFYF